MMCENFALSVFDMADQEDRAGMANKETARVFYNGTDQYHSHFMLILASSFFDILEQFGDLDEEVDCLLPIIIELYLDCKEKQICQMESH